MRWAIGPAPSEQRHDYERAERAREQLARELPQVVDLNRVDPLDQLVHGQDRQPVQRRGSQVACA